MVVKAQVDVLWNVTPCSVVVGYQSYRDPCCLHLHPEELETVKCNSLFCECAIIKADTRSSTQGIYAGEKVLIPFVCLHLTNKNEALK